VNIFQKRYFSKQIDLLSGNQGNNKVNLHILSQTDNVCIFCCYQNDDQINQIIDSMNKMGNGFKKKQLIVYVPLKKCPDILKRSLFIVPVLKTDVNFLGKLSNNVLSSLKSLRYNILINFMSTPSLIDHYFMSLIPAELKIGRDVESSNIYQLIIQLDKDVSFDEYLENIEKYTTRLNGQ
jgi:hypothetical protein